MCLFIYLFIYVLLNECTSSVILDILWHTLNLFNKLKCLFTCKITRSCSSISCYLLLYFELWKCIPLMSCSPLQQYIHTLEASLQEEMSRHAPLYGAGLEALSMNELETLSRIHEEGLRQIHGLQQRKGSPAGSALVSPHNLPHNHGLYTAAAPPPMAVAMPSSLVPNGVGIHGNGHVNGAVGPWFNHT